jgi:hypothetical protein
LHFWPDKFKKTGVAYKPFPQIYGLQK